MHLLVYTRKVSWRLNDKIFSQVGVLYNLKGQPVYKGHFAQFKSSLSCINELVLNGHLSIKDTFLQSLWCQINTGFTVLLKIIKIEPR